MKIDFDTAELRDANLLLQLAEKRNRRADESAAASFC
jgi:hypothetical protein